MLTQPFRIAAVIAFAFALHSAPAFADVPPPDSCTTEGAACSNAGANADQAGQCTQASCTRASPDGSVSYDCLRCAASTDGDASTGGSSKKKDGGGCAFSSRGGSGSALLAALGLLAPVARRRR